MKNVSLYKLVSASVYLQLVFDWNWKADRDAFCKIILAFRKLQGLF